MLSITNHYKPLFTTRNIWLFPSDAIILGEPLLNLGNASTASTARPAHEVSSFGTEALLLHLLDVEHSGTTGKKKTSRAALGTSSIFCVPSGYD